MAKRRFADPPEPWMWLCLVTATGYALATVVLLVLWLREQRMAYIAGMLICLAGGRACMALFDRWRNNYWRASFWRGPSERGTET